MQQERTGGENNTETLIKFLRFGDRNGSDSDRIWHAKARIAKILHISINTVNAVLGPQQPEAEKVAATRGVPLTSEEIDLILSKKTLLA
jgi:hypothetical protein